ncbi:MAG: nicotinate-nucleotide--dimethylbenzimidazole phosphoribosyltransferase [Dehalococcoidia bacterium]|nr:nicotinate-nucleotide--dimethylbenzimidazole phosphoribosyltransferase [Dehalococcoidia bacterium]
MHTLYEIVKRIQPLDVASMQKAALRQDRLTKPRGSLGSLENISIQVAGIRRQPLPQIKNKAVITMAADHGVTAQGISLYPREVTAQMVLNFLRGGAAINILSRQVGARVVIVDMGVAAALPPSAQIINKSLGPGTTDMCSGPAMTRDQAIASLEAGIDIIEQEIKKGLDIAGAGEMGIGNTTAASAITAAITGQPVAVVTGRGTGIGDEQLAHKINIIEKALQKNRPDPEDAIDVLSRVGGFEIGGMAGVMLAGAANHIPVVIDGFISGAAALIAAGICPQVKNYLISSHLSVEKGHSACLKYLDLKPAFDFNMRLGEGTGAALGIWLTEAAVNLLGQMATFSEAGVSDID